METKEAHVNDNVVSVEPNMYMLKLIEMQDQINKINEEKVKLEHQIEVMSAPVERNIYKRKRTVVNTDNEYNIYKSNGVIKASAADSIRSYEDFKKMQKQLLKNGSIRDWCLWTVGIGFGLRISDLLSLQFKNVLEPDKERFKLRIRIYEKKTGKLNECLITEAITFAFRRYFDQMKWNFDMDDFIFSSNKGKGKQPMAPEYAYRILNKAGKDAGLPIHVGSHTMRKSFANIVACVDTLSVDMNTITKVQGLLNHGDQKTTMKYLGTFKDMYDEARRTVSDFILGRRTGNRLNAGKKNIVYAEREEDDYYE